MLTALSLGCGRGDVATAPLPAAASRDAVATAGSVPNIAPLPPHRSAAVLRNVEVIKPWREWNLPVPPAEAEASIEASDAAPATTGVLRRLPAVAPTAADNVPGVDQAPADGDVSSTEQATEPSEQPGDGAPPPAVPTILPDGVIVNPFANVSKPADASESAEPASRSDVDPLEHADVAAAGGEGPDEAAAEVPAPPPAISVVTDAVVPGHLQESWFQMIREAYALANRGATFAARQEFERTLYEITQTKDVLSGGEYTAALARGLRALEEAADFLPAEGSLSAPLKVDVILAGHQTPIATELPATLPASALMEAYHQYAETQFGEAVGGIRAGSMALHALGKLYDRLATEGESRCRDAGDRAITFQRAAMRAHGGNYLAANELGVLLARGGDYVRARQLLVRSLQITPTREAEHNLQIVQTRLAQAQGVPVATARRRPPVTARRPRVEWLPVDRFATMSTGEAAVAPRPAPQPAQSAVASRPGRGPIRQALGAFLPPKFDR